MKTIYLAGSEVFLPEVLSLLQDRKSLCVSFGLNADFALGDIVAREFTNARN
ncbi:hypothetical protein LEP1GSC060_0243 [Leptospira weilii serovar Ranarum str. ICFT]|uniref:Uncharacterized protein n=1 Tax=Leptospira weilii serovar Ranarum str. ICFT TaxID=1218598 RepID=N1WC15_9LEPT|nr:hypothetical protein [Leptospira weilii]EMY76450.1 hypothetical protein LEP1GSC060_0243 [Leptospira weilii serovar Ranarum str. ICFT]